MNRIAYTAFIAFLSSVLTLLAVYTLTADEEYATGRDGLREITLAELAEHDHAESCWKAIHGQVYDLTDYIPDHPTSEEVIVEWCGRESTYGWDNKRPGVPHSPRAESLLEAYRIGVLAGESEAGGP
ncbi:cytochrome b5 domain-containing protein [Billgrantia endophytica]|uniref:Cytochrome b5 n=1 Tax=Billgrantia endophytica TaxID=2033802 RepID=A0A2N7TXL7_9GAMM|nr:cytochrome b5-like heme/steroid binding domain-containing protein [Halomonas endophytica]PMR72895.1 cytochrome b5 [Halomonas endophytica]